MSLTGLELAARISSYWNTIFAERDLIRGHMNGIAAEYAQAMQNFTEAMAALSRFTVPIWHRELWTPIIVRQSELTSVSDYYITFGDETTVFDGSAFFGQKSLKGKFVLPLPADLVSIQAIHNRIINPSLTLLPGVDYVIHNGALILDLDLFSHPLVVRRAVVDEQGLTTDTELLIWGQNTDFDWEYIWQHYGYVLDIPGTSSEIYRDLINIAWDNRVAGAAISRVEALLALISGLPMVIEPEETIQAIETTTENIVVTTNVHTYLLPLEATVTVNVGQVVNAGDFLCAELSVTEMYDHNAVVPDWLLAMPVGHAWLLNMPAVAFPNEEVALTIHAVDADGFVDLRFPLNGDPASVDRFWERAFEAGKLSGKTLADWLDTRAVKMGPQTAADLPSTLNPAQFLIENLLSNHLILVRMKVTSQFRSDMVPYLTLLRGMLPPHVTCLIFLEIAVESAYDGALIENSVRYLLTPSIGSSDNYDMANVTETVTVRFVDGNCVI